MKNIYIKKIIFLAFLIIFQINYSQNIISEVIYKKHSTIDLSKKVQDKTTSLIAKSFELMKELDYVLTFNNYESLFKEKSNLDSDDMVNSYSRGLSRLLGGGRKVYYTNLKTKKNWRQEEFSSKHFLVETSLYQNKWNVTNEIKKIGKYTCYKATTTTTIETTKGKIDRKVVAWYSPDIPMSFGPLGYGDLPGLILEIKIGKFVFLANKILLNKNIKTKIMPPKGTIITEETYLKKTKEGFNRIMNMH